MAMDNPALRARGQDIRIVLFGGTAETVRGVVGLAETSAGEASQPFGDFGPRAWIGFDGDPSTIEFATYIDKATGDRLHRRVTKRERVGTIFPTVQLHMSSEATVMPVQRADFSARDFDPRDFNAA